MPTVVDGLNGNHLIECHHIVSGCRVIDCVHVPKVIVAYGRGPMQLSLFM